MANLSILTFTNASQNCHNVIDKSRYLKYTKISIANIEIESLCHLSTGPLYLQ